MDRRVVGDALGVRLDERRDLRQVVRILDQRVGEGVQESLVEARQGVAVDLHAVAPLEVDGVDRAGAHQGVDDLRRPRDGRIQLEAQPRIALQAPQDGVRRRRVAEPERVDVGHRPRLATDHLVQRATGLREGEVERRRFERPVAPAVRHVREGLRPIRRHRRRHVPFRRPARPLVGPVEVRAELAERPSAHELRLGLRAAHEQGDVLAEALVAGAGEPDQPRGVRLAEPRSGVEPAVGDRLHHERQPRHLPPVVHAPGRYQ